MVLNLRQIIVLIAVVFSSSVVAQRITGKVLDSDNMPLEFANVILNNAEDQLVKTAVTTSSGEFSLQSIPSGSYKLYLSLIGYEAYNQEIKVTEDDLELATIVMASTTSKLSEAAVISEIPLIEVEPDRTVFNVAQNLSSSGSSALEVLRMAPGVQIDNDNNIIVEGKSGVIVYIDDRQSYLQGEELKSYLLALQADEIEKIEVITQPSSKYDAAGNAGIINIILKREKGLGTSGYVSTTVTYGDLFRGNSQLGFTFRTKKWHISGNYSNYTGGSTYFLDFYRIQGNNVFDSETDLENNDFNNNLRFNADYTINDKHTVGAAIKTNLTDKNATSDNSTPISSLNSTVIDSTLTASNTSDANTLNLTSNVFYSYKDTTGNSLTLDLNYGTYGQESENVIENKYLSNEGDVIELNSNSQKTPIDIDIYVAQLDYERKMKSGTLALGSKVSNVVTDNTFEAFNIVNEVSVPDDAKSNAFVYDEQIFAGYLNYNFAIKKKWKVQTGVRMEHTNSEGNLTATSGKETVKRSYTDWFPSGGITFTPNMSHNWALIYSRRIQRPGYQSLNPFEFQINELSFRKGNPFLQPQYANNIKLSNTYKYTLTTSFSYSFISDFSAQVTEAIGDRQAFLSPKNVANQEVYNFSVSYPFKVKKKLSVYANVYSSYSDYSGTDESFVSIDQLTFGGFAQATYSITESVSFQANGWYSGPSVWGGTYRTKSLGAVNVALQKKWKKLTAKVSLNDIFYTQPWNGSTTFGSISIDGNGGGDSRAVQLYLNFNFGNKEVKSKKDRKSGSDDVEKRIE